MNAAAEPSANAEATRRARASRMAWLLCAAAVAIYVIGLLIKR